MTAHYRGVFENWEIAIAKKLIRDFRATSRTLRREEFDDLLQECLIQWLGVRSEYDASREASPRTFMASVVRNKLTDLARERESDKRKAGYLTVSLDAAAGEAEDPSTQAEAIDAELAGETGATSDQDGEDARIDLAKAMQKLTSTQQHICRMLAEGLTVLEASEQLGLPRSTVYDELKRIRKILAVMGLAGYLGK